MTKRPEDRYADAAVFAAYITLLLGRLARGDRTKRLSLACFGATAVVLYAASGIYHAIPIQVAAV